MLSIRLNSLTNTGVPETGSVQEVLIWQTCTVRMMYRIIGTALRDAGCEDHPLDYLAFYCLGKLTCHQLFHELQDGSIAAVCSGQSAHAICLHCAGAEEILPKRRRP